MHLGLSAPAFLTPTQLSPSPQGEAKPGVVGMTLASHPDSVSLSSTEVGPFRTTCPTSAKAWSLEKQDSTVTFCLSGSWHVLGALIATVDEQVNEEVKFFHA